MGAPDVMSKKPQIEVRLKIHLHFTPQTDEEWKQVEDFARYHVGENGELKMPMADWEWDPVWFSVEVDDAC